MQELQERFAKVKAKHGHIQCVYITVLERKNFKYCVTSESLGAKAFTLYWVDNKDRVHEVADSLYGPFTAGGMGLSLAAPSALQQPLFLSRKKNRSPNEEHTGVSLVASVTPGPARLPPRATVRPRAP